MKNNSLALRAKNGLRAVHDSGKRMERVARDKISRVFRYLEGLNQHRNPVQPKLGGQLWSLWLDDLPCHSSVRRGVVRWDPAPVAPDAAARSAAKDGEENFVFKVQRPKLSPPPQPPKDIAGWLKEGWDDPAGEASFYEARPEPERPDQTESHKL